MAGFYEGGDELSCSIKTGKLLTELGTISCSRMTVQII